ncbi:Variable outer membrane protein (plasmid) [Borrelia hermsii YBT]|uniref:Variable outer membrane protein n=1 Tax=Borrelia hermsii YBT TaxID=1313295 RepID=W5T282_BORHE|nr:Variable outer membrane protein [Borrelia hermsii YBT]
MVKDGGNAAKLAKETTGNASVASKDADYIRRYGFKSYV